MKPPLPRSLASFFSTSGSLSVLLPKRLFSLHFAYLTPSVLNCQLPVLPDPLTGLRDFTESVQASKGSHHSLRKILLFQTLKRSLRWAGFASATYRWAEPQERAVNSLPFSSALGRTNSPEPARLPLRFRSELPGGARRHGCAGRERCAGHAEACGLHDSPAETTT